MAGRRGPCGAGHGPGHLLDQDQPANGFWLEETEGLAARRPASFGPAGEALHATGRPRVISGSARTYCAHCPARTMQLALEDLKSEQLELVSSGVSFDEYILIVGRDRWSAIERRFDVEGADA